MTAIHSFGFCLKISLENVNKRDSLVRSKLYFFTSYWISYVMSVTHKSGIFLKISGSIVDAWENSSPGVIEATHQWQ